VKVPYGEGIAYHIGPESCAGARKEVGEALTGGMQAGTLSRENNSQSADALILSGRQYGLPRKRERQADSARSKTPSMHASFSDGNRESLRLAVADGATVRTVNSKDQDGDERSRQSDSRVVPKKLSNKANGAPVAAERVEGRRLAKGNE